MSFKKSKVLSNDSPASYSSRFIFKKTVLIKNTNIFGNTYFTNYIDWQGEVRESFFLKQPTASRYLKKNPDILLVTHSLHHRFLSNTFLGDVVRIEMTTRDIFQYSLTIIFHYFNDATSKPIGEGWQKICFMKRNAIGHCKVPPFFLRLALSIKEQK